MAVAAPAAPAAPVAIRAERGDSALDEGGGATRAHANELASSNLPSRGAGECDAEHGAAHKAGGDPGGAGTDDAEQRWAAAAVCTLRAALSSDDGDRSVSVGGAAMGGMGADTEAGGEACGAACRLTFRVE